MDKALSIADIRTQFDSEWVLIEDPQTNEYLEVLGGKVLYHSRDRTEFDREVLKFHPKRFAVVYTGKRRALPLKFWLLSPAKTVTN